VPLEAGIIYDYAQPIPVVTESAVAIVAEPPAESALDSAIAAFRLNDYDTALDLVHQAIARSPEDAVLHEFRALVLFAKGDYRQAAATVHSVLAIGPGWDWQTLSGLYADVAVYTAQLRTLEEFAREHPGDAGARFLLAYHYMSGGYPDVAAGQLRRVVQIVPEDRVAADVLRMLNPSGDGGQLPAAQQEPVPQPPDEPLVAESRLDAAALAGTWRASRSDGTAFELILTDNATFTWKSSKGTTSKALRGKYTLEGNVLAMERSDGGSLVGEIAFDGERRLRFKPLGAPADDTGLDFAR
jgi:tetratricopeptide (TPR) repeat protein